MMGCPACSGNRHSSYLAVLCFVQNLAGPNSHQFEGTGIPACGTRGPPDPLAIAGDVSSDGVEQSPSSPNPGEKRLCDGCPRRRIGTSFLQVTYVNGFYELANLIRGQDTAHITPKTWWTNMKQGWVWDLDDFTVNQFGHPYQGNNYFTTGRANGLSFWESAALTAFGSGTWEYFGETNQASLNDFINTTLGGIALGEMFHRTAWLVRDTHGDRAARACGRRSGATAIDPMTGVNRFISGDASRVSEKPAEMVPSRSGRLRRPPACCGAARTPRTSSRRSIRSSRSICCTAIRRRAAAGRPTTHSPCASTSAAAAAISEVRVRGRLLGQPYQDGALQLMVAQGYQFNKNAAYQFGAESVETSVSTTRDLSPTLFVLDGRVGRSHDSGSGRFGAAARRRLSSPRTRRRTPARACQRDPASTITAPGPTSAVSSTSGTAAST